MIFMDLDVLKKWKGQTKCCMVRDEVGLLKVKLGVLAVFCLILGAFVVTFKVLYINGNLTKEQEKWNAERKNMTDQLSETQRKLNETVKSYEILSKRKTMLEKELEVVKSGCAADWKYHSGKCYYFSSDEKSWTESRDSCVSMGGHLVIINSEEEWSFLKQAKASQVIKGITEEYYWIGLTDSVTEGDWRWLDNTPLSLSPEFWHGNEPDDWKGNNNEYPDGEDCAKMSVTPTVYGFYDASCKDTFKKVCEAIAVK